MKTRNSALAAVMAIAMLVFTACEKNDMNGVQQSTPETFTVKMTDSPADYQGLEIEITSVQAYNQNTGWVVLNSDSRIVSVLDLTNGKEMTLVDKEEVQSGNYSKLKIVYGDQNQLQMDASLLLGINIMGMTVVNGIAYIHLNWDTPKETVINIDQEVSDENGAEVLLDFNAAQSVEKENDHYTIEPVIYEVKDRNTGVHGQVTGVTSALVVLTDGTDSWSTYIDANGYFMFRGMEEGDYDMVVKPCECELEQGMDSQKEVDDIAVAEGKITSVQTVNF